MNLQITWSRRVRNTTRARFRGATLFLLMLMAIVFPLGAGAHDSALLTGDNELLADAVPSARAATIRAADELSTYHMDVTLDPAVSTIGGDMTVTWRNPADQPLSEVWFRLFPNAYYYKDGGLTVEDVTVDGRAVTQDYALDDTALRVPLPEPVAPGDTAEIALDFTTTVPDNSTGSFGIFNHDTQNGSWVLSDWQPLLAVWEQGSGWALPPVTSLGDPTYSASAFYDVEVTAPRDLTVVATGVVEKEETGTSTITRRLLAGPARDFVMVADDNQVPRSRDVDGTHVNLWTSPDLPAATNDKVLDIASSALRYYSAHFRTYPAREVDLVQTDPHGALGIAWTGLIFLDGPSLLSTYDGDDPGSLTTVVAHEVSHLWWGIMVGGDSNKHAFIQEGLATVSSLLYDEATIGPEAAKTQLDAWVVQPARRLLDEGDAVVDVPFKEGENEALRSDAVYGKGSLGFLAIRKEIGDEAFDAALRDIADRYAWGEMTPEQLLTAFEDASGKDLHPLWNHWFNEASMTREEIDAVAAAFA